MVYSWEEIGNLLNRPIELPFPVELHMVRHGETEANARSLVTGVQDSPLTALGREQARAVGRRLDPRYDLAIHSRLSRSAETLQLAMEAGQVGVGAVYPDARINERSLGELEMTPVRPIEEFARGDFDYAPAGGDSYAEVSRRLLSFLIDLIRFIRRTDATAVLICGHMGPMRIMAGIFEELRDPSQVLARSFKNTEVFRVRWHRLAFPAFLASIAAKSA
ncbi:Phosphoglycerate mutase family 1 [Fimbriiglobus ruber]|uniref:Phosphoglycerate mutase family 1 n=1 Tax=Fimbriiglobus ruber TaxID=1908690 RepID=A0A225DMJ4_9BACT|nr:Phosphoglycerate mutase family 1 [Fimbriiglobus ruber]